MTISERLINLDIEDPIKKLYWQMKKLGYKGKYLDVKNVKNYIDGGNCEGSKCHDFAVLALAEMEKPEWFYPPDARAESVMNEISERVKALFPDEEKSAIDVLYEQSQKRRYKRSRFYFENAFNKPKARAAKTCWAILIGLESDMGVF